MQDYPNPKIMSTTVKIFPKSRVCVIDAFSSIEEGLRKAVDFALKHDIQLNSTDGKHLIMGFCLEYIEHTFRKTTSSYPKVFCVGTKATNSNLQHFIDKHIDEMMSHLPHPYCGKVLFTSPDLETAALSCLKIYKPRKRYIKFANKLRLKNI
jgi:hypothetical protein